MPRKLYSTSFAARLTAPERDELFRRLSGDLTCAAAAKLIHEWSRPRLAKPPTRWTVSKWYHREKLERDVLAIRTASILHENATAEELDTAARRALGQALFESINRGLEPTEIAAYARLHVAKDKLVLDSERFKIDQRLARASIALDRARLLLERVRGGESTPDLKHQIDLALQVIHEIKHGAREDAS